MKLCFPGLFGSNWIFLLSELWGSFIEKKKQKQEYNLIDYISL